MSVCPNCDQRVSRLPSVFPDVCGKCRIASGEKICQQCGDTKPLSDFYGAPSTADGVGRMCRPCASTHITNHRKHHTCPTKIAAWAKSARVKKDYGLTADEYDELLAKPCGICGGESEALDHDHETGRVRAALCHKCNWGLGHFGDDPARLLAAREYVMFHSLVAELI